MESYIIAIIGVAGVIVGALISGAFQMIVTKKSINSAEKQFEIQMEQSRKEFLSNFEQIREEQKRIIITMASEKIDAQSNRFYSDLIGEMKCYDRLLNELHYLNNITHPNNKQMRMSSGDYPHIKNAISDIVGDTNLHQTIAKLLGALRCNIDLYNSALDSDVPPETLENALSRIFKLIEPINEERFNNYAGIQTNLRKYELEKAQEQLQQIQ